MATITNIYSTAGTTNTTMPADVTQMVIECYGGGGAGAGAASGTNVRRGGGGGGGYSKTTLTTGLTEGLAISIVVAAAIVGTTGNAANGNFSEVTVDTISRCKANGGSSAVTNTAGGGGSTTGAVGDTKYAGGSGGSYVSLGSGCGGGCAGATGVGGNGGEGSDPAQRGTDGGGVAGVGGQGMDFDGAGNGGDGNIYGAGGGGAVRLTTGSYSGGSGPRGYVKIVYTTLDVTSRGHFLLSAQ